MKIVFMGTPEFACETLETILKSHHQVVAVVTTPDKPAGRGLNVQYSEVKKMALHYQLPILQPEKMNDAAFVEQLKQLNADLFVVVAFRMLPEIVFSIPPKGTFNVHASLLPQYRGAAPIQRAIMNGEKVTGVTTFFIDNKMDTGDIIDQVKIPIEVTDTAGILYDKLKVAGAHLALKTINDIENNTISKVAQQKSPSLFFNTAPKIFKEDMHICWDKPAIEIYNQIRGLSPFPGAYSLIKSISGEILTLKCFSATIETELSVNNPGTLSIVTPDKIVISSKDYQISLRNIQLQGKKRMEVKDFIRGFRFENYTLFLF